jgi:rRNA maturation RNase YbeY
MKRRAWILEVLKIHSFKLGELNIIFTDDEYLLDINKEYLNHDFYTDIITFNNCEGDVISGDLFISVDRVKENSVSYNESFERELNRVIIHGILHLMGYDDLTKEDEKSMRAMENNFLELF